MHAEVDLRADIQSLMDCLREYRVYLINLGRMLEADEIAKEVLGIGWNNLTAGEKNPLSDYNSFIDRLKKRRRMRPVNAPNPSDVEAGEQVSPTRALANSTSTSAQPAITPAQEPNMESPAEMSDNEEGEGEDRTELEGILEDLEKGAISEPTLARESEDDVAYDMDEVMVEVSDNEQEESDNSTDRDSDGDGDGEWD